MSEQLWAVVHPQVLGCPSLGGQGFEGGHHLVSGRGATRRVGHYGVSSSMRFDNLRFSLSQARRGCSSSSGATGAQRWVGAGLGLGACTSLLGDPEASLQVAHVLRPKSGVNIFPVCATSFSMSMWRPGRPRSSSGVGPLFPTPSTVWPHRRLSRRTG